MKREWTFVENELILIRGQTRVPVPPKPAAVLTYLVRCPGEIVRTQTILKRVWGNYAISPDLVREYIHDLRGLLGDSAKSPKYIETIRGIGFRLIGGVILGQHRPDVLETAIMREKARVLLSRPKVLHSSRRWRDYANLLAERLLIEFGRHKDIDIVADSRVDSMANGVSRQPGSDRIAVDYALESSIHVSRKALELHVQLVDAETGVTLWGKRLDGTTDSAEAVADKFVVTTTNAVGGWRGAVMRREQALLAGLQVKLPMSAYDRYVLALHHERQRTWASMQKGRRHVEASVHIAPSHARAWLLRSVLLERQYLLFGVPLSADEWSRSAGYIERAVTADPDDPMVLAEAANARARTGDFGGAMTALEQSTEFGAAHADALTIVANGFATIADEPSEARRLLASARKLLPTPDEWCRFTVARIAYLSGDFDECRSATGPSSELLPLATFNVLALAMGGLRDEAHEAHQRLLNRFPDFDFEAYASAIPIAGRSARNAYFAGVARLG